MQTNLVYGGSCSVKKELPKEIRLKRAHRKAHFKVATVAALTRKTKSLPKVKPAGTVAVKYSICGAQCSGQINFTRSFVRKNTPTFDANGEYIHIVSSKVKRIPSGQWRGNGRAIKKRVKFTREQRIDMAKDLAKLKEAK